MTDKKKVILVFGLPGAGKSTIINEVVRSNPLLIRLSGGSLIGKDLTEAERDHLRKLGANEILKNQELLVLGFLKAVAENLGKTIIFDGHCIVKDGENLVEVPTDIIARLTPSLIVFLNPLAEDIVSRRLGDVNRPEREPETVAQIEKLQARQIALCQEYSRSLNVPLQIISDPSVDKFRSVIMSMLS